jgi:hypothetical protein
VKLSKAQWKRLKGFDKFPSLAGTHEHAEAAYGLSPDASREVLGAQFIRTRWRPAGLPGWLADHPVASSSGNRSGRVGLSLIRGRRGHRASDTQTLVESLGGLLARREGRLVRGRGAGRSGRRVGGAGFDRRAGRLSFAVSVLVGIVDGNSGQGLRDRAAEAERLWPEFGSAGGNRGSRGGRRHTVFARGWGHFDAR